MFHLGYTWDIFPSGIMLDEELNVKGLGWRPGDYFKLVEVDGRLQLIKVDPLIKFVQNLD